MPNIERQGEVPSGGGMPEMLGCGLPIHTKINTGNVLIITTFGL